MHVGLKSVAAAAAIALLPLSALAVEAAPANAAVTPYQGTAVVNAQVSCYSSVADLVTGTVTSTSPTNTAVNQEYNSFPLVDSGSSVLEYSNDHGATWTVSPVANQSSTTEGEVFEYEFNTTPGTLYKVHWSGGTYSGYDSADNQITITYPATDSSAVSCASPTTTAPARRTITVTQIGHHPNFVKARVRVTPADKKGVLAQMKKGGRWKTVKRLTPTGGIVVFRGLGPVRIVAKADGTYKQATWKSRISKHAY